jgi:uncharacterized membrane protein HdeD (DUF308 family)
VERQHEKYRNRQANFNWWLPSLAGVGGIFAGWKIFGGSDEKKENPLMFYILLGVLLLILGLGTFFIVKKINKK